VIEPGEPYEEMERKVKEALSVYFKPEVMGRIGNNVVVFDFISEDASKLIARSQIDRINRGIQAKFGIEVNVHEDAFDLLFAWARNPEIVDKGGRGIGNLVESAYLNPLSTYLFDHGLGVGSSVVISARENTLAFDSARE
jgi:ATP-dependent Clp protease ATP-binding subunit ClpA